MRDRDSAGLEERALVVAIADSFAAAIHSIGAVPVQARPLQKKCATSARRQLETNERSKAELTKGCSEAGRLLSVPLTSVIRVGDCVVAVFGLERVLSAGLLGEARLAVVSVRCTLVAC